MTITQLMTAVGPYYIMGFLITFFSLMSARYTLGYDIQPQRKFMRICFVSLFWFLSLLISAIIVSYKRGRDMIRHDKETEKLLQELEAYRTGKATADLSTDIKPAQTFTENDVVNVHVESKKKFFTW